MFGKLPLVIIKNPAGTYSFAGRIPTNLGCEAPATKADIMGQRAHYNDRGELVTWKFPVFKTESEAIKYARERGHSPA